MLKKDKIIICSAVAVIFILIGLGVFWIWPQNNVFIITNNSATKIISKIIPESSAQRLTNPPHPIKGIYISAWTAYQSQKISELIQLINKTELNAVVVDVKDATGKFSYKVDIPLAQKSGANSEIKIKDIDEFINLFHKNNIYVIGRVQVFQDPVLARARPDIAIKHSQNGKLWQDKNGLEWLDPSSRIVWQYAEDIAKDMAQHGFDEVNFDYVRFPTDGMIQYLDFSFWDGSQPKHELIGSFFAYLSNALKDQPLAKSVDLFGLAAYQAAYFNLDLNIGQRLIDALPYFDYVSPMVYPSHYPANFNGLKDPIQKPYEVVFVSLKNAQNLIATTSSKAKLRPWLEDFDLNGVAYDKTKVRAQIQATYDAGAESWLLWNSGSRYTKEALMAQ